jgi:hypothetical protein
MAVELRTINAGGELPLGKKHAGRTVAVEEVETGVWIVKAAQAIPDSELWLHEPAFARKLDRALEWAEQHPRVETDLSKLEAKLEAKLAARPARPRTRQTKK